MPPDLTLALGCIAVAVAVVQLALARWRDLGPLTVGLVGATVVLAGTPTVGVGSILALAAVFAAAGWARGGLRGVGRPGLTGTVGAAALVAWVAAAALPLWFELDPLATRQVAAVLVGVVALLCAAVALERKRGGGPGVRWVGEIPIRQPP